MAAQRGYDNIIQLLITHYGRVGWGGEGWGATLDVLVHGSVVCRRSVTVLLSLSRSLSLSLSLCVCVCVCAGALTDIRDNSGKLPRDVAKKTVSSRSRGMLCFDVDDSVPSTTR